MTDPSRAYFLNTERLAFGRWSQADGGLAMTLWGDSRVSAFLGGPFTPEQVRERLLNEIEMMRTRKMQYWPVFLREDGEFAGCAGFRPYGEGERELELGFHFRSRYWGKGLAYEAASAAIAFAFAELGAQNLIAGHHPANLASARLVKKLGFLYTRQEFYPPTGEIEPIYRLTNLKQSNQG